jgi:hypothetical protein
MSPLKLSEELVELYEVKVLGFAAFSNSVLIETIGASLPSFTVREKDLLGVARKFELVDGDSEMSHATGTLRSIFAAGETQSVVFPARSLIVTIHVCPLSATTQLSQATLIPLHQVSVDVERVNVWL